MKLLIFELKKLFSLRFMWLILAVFLAINCYLSFYFAKENQPVGITNQELRDFYEIYLENPEVMDIYYRELVKSSSVKDPAEAEADIGDIEVTQRYAPDGYTDAQMFVQLYESIAQAKAYPDTADRIIESAQKNLAEFRAMGISEDSYNYRLQEKIIDTYGELKNTVRIGIEHSYGWAEYFDYNAQNIFIFISVILIVVAVMSNDRTTGILPIIHCTPKGKSRSAFAKIVVIFISVILLVLNFSLSSFAIIGITNGFSSSANAIQSVKGFEYCQYSLSIAEYHAISLGMRMLAFMCLGAFVAVITALIQNNVIAFAIGIIVYMMNFGINTMQYVNADNAFKNLNLIAVTDIKPLFVRLRSFNFFGYVWSYVPMMICVFGFLTFLAFSAASVVYCKRRSTRSTNYRRKNFFKKIKARINNICIPQIKCTNLVKSELYKMLISSGMIFVILILAVCKIAYASRVYERGYSATDQVYFDYMTELEGEITDEKLTFIESERKEVNDILGASDEMQMRFINGEITSAEYAEYLKRYTYAQSKDGYLEIIEERRDYLLRIAENNRKGWFLYDTGWLRLINSGADYFLLISLAMVFCLSFAMEYKSSDISDGFVRILKTTPNGRRKTFNAKMIAVATVSLMLCIFHNLIDIIFVIKNYSLPAITAPLASISQFEALNSTMSVLGYLIILYTVRCVFAVLFAFIVSAFSCLSKHGLSAFLTIISIVVIPVALSQLGFDFATKFNYLLFFAGTPLIVSSFSEDLFNTEYGLLFVTIFSIMIITIVLLLSSYKKWNNQNIKFIARKR